MKPKSIKSLFSIWAALAVALFIVPALARATETLTFIHNDVAGSPVAATDVGGNVIWRETYRPYGERKLNQSNAAGNRQFFHGKPFDSDTGLSYFGARYYDPIVGRFMGVDAVGFREDNLHSFNRYAYGNSNPYKFTDPDGRAVVPLVIGIIGLAYVAYEMHPMSMPQVPFNSGVAAPAIGPGEVVGVFAGLRGLGMATVARPTGEVAAGKVPLWTATKNQPAAENAFRHFKDHGADFGAQNAVDYVRKAKEFLHNPPTGSLTKTRSNGDIVRFDPATDMFGVMDKTGAPRTFFKPDPAKHGYPTNRDYFNAQ